MARYGRRKRRGRRPRRGRRSRRRIGGLRTLASIGQVLPNAMSLKMRYCQHVSLTQAVSSVPIEHVFRANSIFDPDFTGAGHQPYGRDQFTGFYDHYMVVGSKITVNFESNTTATGSGTYIAYITLRDASSAGSGFGLPALCESGQARYKLCTNSHGSRGVGTLSHFFSPKKFFHVQDVKDNERLSAPVGANPTEGAFFHIGVCAPDPADLAAEVDCWVTIEYLVVLREPRQQLGS